MNRPTLEVADIIRTAGDSFIARHRSQLTWPQLKVLRAIRNCRTVALGGHLDRCTRCGHQAVSYNSCRNRHCPKCQTNKRDQWLAKQTQDLLPVPYFHLVFTLPHELSALVLQNRKLLYDLLLRSSADTLLEVAAGPAHLGAHIGFLSVLHTWGQNLLHHPHAHCVIPAGGLALEGSRWIHPRPGFFLPVRVLSKVFRGKFTQALKNLARRKKLQFHAPLQGLAEPRTFAKFLRQLFRQDWVVYAKPPFGGPEHLLHYLARYTHRVAISNHRLLAFDNDQVTFRWKDYAHHNKKRKMTVSTDEFLRRFLLHLLPRGFTRIRHFGILANRYRARVVPLCQQLLMATPRPCSPTSHTASQPAAWRCPGCGGPMLVIEHLTPQQIRWWSADQGSHFDTS
jgi:Putative transposase/Transposase zinc-binding domain